MSTSTPSTTPTTPRTTRHEQRLLSSTPRPPTERTSLKQFQDQLEQAHHNEAIARVAAQVAKIALADHASTTAAPPPDPRTAVDHDDADDDDPRPLRDRLLTPTQESNSVLASLLARTLDLNRGELELHLAHHNLTSTSVSSLFEIPEPCLEPVPPVTFLLPPQQLKRITHTIQNIAQQIGADASILHNPFDDDQPHLHTSLTTTPSAVNDDPTTHRWSNKALRILVRKIAESAHELSEVRVAVVGNVDAGKSSLLGVLTKGRLDDGRGRARVSLFRHKHEIESGRTSSVGIELLGFTSKGQAVMPEAAHVALLEKSTNTLTSSNAAHSNDPETPVFSQRTGLRKQQLSWEQISASASKLISFSDLAGHERYLKTTLFGLTATSPDFVLLIVAANAGLIGMSKEHLSVALALSVPIVCVVTKIDSTPAHVLEQTIKQLVKILRSPGCRKNPVFVKDPGMACELASSFAQAKACPIFLVSNVTGQGLNLVKTFLNVAPVASKAKFPLDADFECSISDVFSVPFVGAVASGTIMSGVVHVGDTVLLGPDSLGGFVATAIKSIQRKRVNVDRAEAGQSVSFALKRVKRSQIRKGMVLLAKTEVPPVAVSRFEGQVLILYHNTLISPHYQAMMHLGPIRQTVQIEAIVDKACIRTGDRATVQFRFIKHAEFIRVGDRFLFREGRTKALGVVTKLIPNTKNLGHGGLIGG
ncbi:BQ2448_4584 [Microbotryum intermedium]|uniref:BQ2448_4584 protein n=1 Tax=Microbotryum intermedium TaxID=269621 RepID=A0A238FDH6_9BASI|nr:BQ2448_4584 [Microbotryum intermedium]